MRRCSTAVGCRFLARLTMLRLRSVLTRRGRRVAVEAVAEAVAEAAQGSLERVGDGAFVCRFVTLG